MMLKLFMHFILVLLLLLSTPSTQAGPKVGREYQIKAAFLYNFANFVDWPAEAFAFEQQKLMICVLGEDPFGRILDITTSNVSAKGRLLDVTRLAVNNYPAKIKEGLVCHILFVSRSAKEHVKSITDNFKRRPVLTVSDIEGFVCRGGMVEFYREGRKIRLRLHLSNLQAAALKADANLLRLTKITDADDCP